MAKKNIIDILLNTIGEIQKNNRKDPKVETADPNLFNLIKGKLKNLDEKTRETRKAKGKSPDSILDLIRNEIEGVRKQNLKDPGVKTAPKSIFEELLSKLDKRPNKEATKGLGNIIEEYNLDIRKLPNKVLNEIQAKYLEDKKKMDRQYAQAIHDLAKKYK